MALVHNPTQPGEVPLIARAVVALLSNISSYKAWTLVSSLLKSDVPPDRAAILEIVSNSGVEQSKMEELLMDSAGTASKVIEKHVAFCGQVLELEPGQAALLSNGRVLV